MNKIILLIVASILTIVLGGCNMPSEKSPPRQELPAHLKNIDLASVDWKAKDDQYWKDVLSPEQFKICRKADTERPFSGAYCQFKTEGTYRCACCGLPLFGSSSKFDSGTGWPSFTEAVDGGALIERVDNSFGMKRVEVVCGRCNAHLGHVFDDGPPPTHKRFCINSVCLLHDSGK